jgi:hypothetical protein
VLPRETLALKIVAVEPTKLEGGETRGKVRRRAEENWAFVAVVE